MKLKNYDLNKRQGYMYKYEQRQTELDLLRIVALIAVILVHAMGNEGLDDFDIRWWIYTFVSAIVTWQVPVFVMISGRFFLDPEREVSMKKLWTKYIPHIFFAFAFWDFLYQLYYIFTGVYEGLNWKGVFTQSLIGPYHFWYLHMLIWLYAIVPFLRKITISKRLMEYFIVLFVVFEFLTNYGVLLPGIGDTLAVILNKVSFHFALGYSGYYILGYYLYKYDVSKKIELIIYLLGIIAMLSLGLCTLYLSATNRSFGIDFTQYLMPNIILEACAVYTFFVRRLSKIDFSIKIKYLMTKLAEISFGIYLVHALVLGFIGELPIPIPVTLSVCVTFFISGVLVYFIRKIPVIGRIIT